MIIVCLALTQKCVFCRKSAAIRAVKLEEFRHYFDYFEVSSRRHLLWAESADSSAYHQYEYVTDHAHCNPA